MAKTALVADSGTENKPNPLVHHTTNSYERARSFLSDVRNEMRKVVTPSRKEVQATTTVVLVTVFVFSFYFWIVDGIFSNGVKLLLSKLAGQ
ncbi:preprotein translocase subunit SecE [Acidicapsa ligni]|uniref:preprotein translocase subunit SecE n=1 Tax=Acidicapsa ligni TaxID=542300 RepID=UPI0021DFD398|nr:preprotein translocase subunit SecE [Acidicapsa ligni]